MSKIKKPIGRPRNKARDISDFFQNVPEERLKSKGINKEQFEKLCRLYCSFSEVAGFFGVSNQDLENWVYANYNTTFDECRARFGADAKISLRRAQFAMATDNPTMAIFLGKNLLGQSENPIGGNAENIEFHLEVKNFKCKDGGDVDIHFEDGKE